MKIIIDPRCRISYAAYYIKGLENTVGKTNLIFETKPFQNIGLLENKKDYNRGMLMIAKDKNWSKKIFIDFDDPDTVSEKHYTWSDVYAKINVKKGDLQTFEKLLAIGPSFGINIINVRFIAIFAKLFFTKDKPVGISQYIRDYLYMPIRRRPYHEYLGSHSKDNYIFSISTLWYDANTDKTTNTFRGTFFRLCREKFSVVEGGFFYIKNENILKEFPQYSKYKTLYKDFLVTKRISPLAYLAKTKKSALVFNTPSVMGCHGWKLAEYLAMGKAIISTQFINEMPGDFDYDKTVIMVDDDIQIGDTIDQLRENTNLREKMEKNAFLYFSEHLSPESVVEKILRK